MNSTIPDITAPEPKTPFYKALYPPFRPRRTPRQLTYAVARNDSDGNMTITNEHGEIESIEYGDDFYRRIRDYAYTGAVMLWRNLADGDALDVIIHNALDDRAAHVLCTKRGVSGVCWWGNNKNRRSGALISGACWNIDETDDYKYLHAIRQFSDDRGIGDCFSLSALGALNLTHYWFSHKLRREIATPDGLRRDMARYAVGGRSETLVSRDDVIDTASELDLKSAYTTAAMLLPMGKRSYVPKRVNPLDSVVRQRYGAIYGKWRITYTDDVAHSPIAQRSDNFTTTEQATSDYTLRWSARAGDTYIYGGWHFEVQALLETGAATAEWLGGYGWGPLSDSLAAWVESLWEMRANYKARGETHLETFAKMLGNAVVGRWGMTGATTIVTRADAQDGDRVWIPRGANGWVRDWGTSTDGEQSTSDFITGELFIHTDNNSAPRTATPVHLLSYVQAATRMEEYRQLRAQLESDRVVIATNVDSCWIVGGDGANIETDAYTPHAWVWAVKSRRIVRVVYNRGFVYVNADTREQESRLPGIPKGETRAVILSRHMGMLRELSRRQRVGEQENQREEAKAPYAT